MSNVKLAIFLKEKSELESQITAAKTEALACFGNDEIYIEKFLVNPRHIEFQILAGEILDRNRKILTTGVGSRYKI